MRRIDPELDRRVRWAVAEMPNLDTPTAVLADDLPVRQHHARIQCLHQQVWLDACLAPGRNRLPADRKRSAAGFDDRAGRTPHSFRSDRGRGAARQAVDTHTAPALEERPDQERIAGCSLPGSEPQGLRPVATPVRHGLAGLWPASSDFQGQTERATVQTGPTAARSGRGHSRRIQPPQSIRRYRFRNPRTSSVLRTAVAPKWHAGTYSTLD